MKDVLINKFLFGDCGFIIPYFRRPICNFPKPSAHIYTGGHNYFHPNSLFGKKKEEITIFLLKYVSVGFWAQNQLKF